MLTTAWGDTILPNLRPGVKAFLSSGRFVRVEDEAAVYALPDRGLLVRAESVRPEAEASLASHFGRKIPLLLVLDDGAVPVTRPVPAPEDEDPSHYNLDDLEDAGPALVSPEQRLMEAFPGAEEVAP